jgi:hypothetical protein
MGKKLLALLPNHNSQYLLITEVLLPSVGVLSTKIGVV